MSKQVQFVVIKPGFVHGSLKKVGETFTEDESFKAKWAKPAGSKELEAATPAPSILDNTIPVIVEALPDLTLRQLRDLENEETAGQRRKGVLGPIGDAIANREMLS